MFGLFGKKEVKVYAPADGEIIALEQVPDVAFAQKMVGDGGAVVPSSGTICAPVKGKITLLFSTCHAVGITTAEGLEFLVHIGVDTVSLNGEGFKPLCSQGDTINVGDPLVEVDLAFLQSKSLHSVTPVLITNMELVKSLTLQTGSCKRGDLLYTAVLK